MEAESLQSELLPPQRSSQELGPWTQHTQRVRRSSASGSSVASLRFSKLILSRGLWFQAKSTASWKVVTSRSYWPTSFLKVIWKPPPEEGESSYQMLVLMEAREASGAAPNTLSLPPGGAEGLTIPLDIR